MTTLSDSAAKQDQYIVGTHEHCHYFPDCLAGMIIMAHRSLPFPANDGCI